MEYEFHLQDPTSAQTMYLFEAIVAAARDAASCDGMFAFASRAGVDSLMADTGVQSLLQRGVINLLVGIDAVTNRPTLERLRDLEAAHASLRVRVFWNQTPGLFHPKLAMFRYPDGRRSLIVGSGNLTPGGLRQNFEAFSIVRAGARERLDVGGWERFRQAHAANIRAIDDEALERAARNIIRGGRARPRADIEPDAVVAAAVPVAGEPLQEQAAALSGTGRVLVSLVPSAGDRWHQVHFNHYVMDNFFRITPNSSQRLYLTEVMHDGTSGDQETRPYVLSTANSNPKVELASHHGAPYPNNGRPIAVFRETQARAFDYMLLMPGDDGHDQMNRLLTRLPNVGKGLARVITDAAELRRDWPTCPLLAERTAEVAAG
jgi:hypothetical protein